MLENLNLNKPCTCEVTASLDSLAIGESCSSCGGSFSGIVTWDDVIDKPSTFPPSAHTHVYTDITNFQSGVLNTFVINPGSAPVGFFKVTSVISNPSGFMSYLSYADTDTDGVLSFTDWNTFNSKYPYPTGTTSEYVRGDGSIATFPTFGGTYFQQNLNAFGVTANLGTSDNFGLVFKTNNLTRGGFTNSGNFYVSNLAAPSSAIVYSDGTGTLNKVNLTGLTSDYLSGNGTFQTLTSLITFENGLTEIGSIVRLGGPLVINTDIATSGFNLTFTQASSRSLIIGNDGTLTALDAAVSNPKFQYGPLLYNGGAGVVISSLGAVATPLATLHITGRTNTTTSNTFYAENRFSTSILRFSDAGELYIRQDGLDKYIYKPSGYNSGASVVISALGAAITPAATLHVRGSNNVTNRTTLFENSDGKTIILFNDQGIINIGNANSSGWYPYQVNLPDIDGSNLTFDNRTDTGNASNGAWRFYGSLSFSGTTGAQYTVAITKGFAPTSGSATFASLLFNSTINQTGSTGITRGIYSNPTLTSAYNYRAFEFTSVAAYTPNAAISNYFFSTINPTINASVNNQTLTGLEINMSGSNGAFTGVIRNALTLIGGGLRLENGQYINTIGQPLGSGMRFLNGSIDFYNNTANKFGSLDFANSKLVMNNTGRALFGVDTSSSQSRVYIEAFSTGSLEALDIRDSGGVNSRFHVRGDGVSKFNGSVGINISGTPLYTLDVEGSIRADHNLGFYGVQGGVTSFRVYAPAVNNIIFDRISASNLTFSQNGSFQARLDSTGGWTVYGLAGGSTRLATVSSTGLFGTTTPSAFGLVETSRTLSINNVTQDLSANRSWRTSMADTGALTYAGISVASATTVNIGACTGIVVDNETDPLNPVYVNVTYAGETNKVVPTIGSATGTYVLLRSDGVIHFQTTYPTSAQRKTHIYLSKISHPNLTSISFAIDEVDFITSPTSQFRDLFQAIVYINTGVTATPNANLTIANTAGTILGNGIRFVTDRTNGNNLPVASSGTTSFLILNQSGAAGSFTTTIDPANYDVGGVTTPVGGGTLRSTLQYLWYAPGAGFALQRGQTVYDTLVDAIAAVGRESFVIRPNLVGNSILIGVFAMRHTTTNLSDTTFARFFPSDKFGQVGGSSSGISTATFQTTYNNSSIPQILLNAQGAFTIRNSGAYGADTLALQQWQNTAGTTTASINGNGSFVASGLLNVSNNATFNGVSSSLGQSKVWSRFLDIGTTTNNGIVGIQLGVFEGANNRSVGLFLDDSTGTYGFTSGASTGVSTFVLQNTGSTLLSVDSGGRTKIGAGSPATNVTLEAIRDMTGNTFVSGIVSSGVIQSVVTNASSYFATTASTATSVTSNHIYHYYANQGTFGAGSSINNQYGFYVENTLTGATNNYAFHSILASGAGRWNIYMAGTAANYFAGNVGIGTTNIFGKVEISAGLPTSIPTYLDTAFGTTISDGGNISLRLGVSNFSGSGGGFPSYIQAGNKTGPVYYNILLNPLGGNISVGSTTATSLFNVGTAAQFQVASTGTTTISRAIATDDNFLLITNTDPNGGATVVIRRNNGTTGGTRAASVNFNDQYYVGVLRHAGSPTNRFGISTTSDLNTAGGADFVIDNGRVSLYNQNASGVTNYRFTINGDSTNLTPGVLFQQSGTNIFRLGTISATSLTDVELWNQAAGYLRFGTANSETMRMQTTAAKAQVSIGTTTMFEPLRVFNSETASNPRIARFITNATGIGNILLTNINTGGESMFVINETDDGTSSFSIRRFNSLNSATAKRNSVEIGVLGTNYIDIMNNSITTMRFTGSNNILVTPNASTTTSLGKFQVHTNLNSYSFVHVSDLGATDFRTYGFRGITGTTGRFCLDALNDAGVFQRALMTWEHSTGNVGIGTNSPQRALHLSNSNGGIYNILALDNPDTTNNNGLAISWRVTTTGTGASAFNEIISIVGTTTVHDHPTRTSTLNFYTYNNGSVVNNLILSGAGDATIAGATKTLYTSGFYLNNAGTMQSRWYQSGTTIIYDRIASTDVQWQQAGSAQMWLIGSTGNLGVGITPNASAKIHANGAIWSGSGIGNGFAINNSGTVQTTWNVVGTDSVFSKTVGGSWLWQHGGGTQMNLTVNGHLWLGAPLSPTARLQVKGHNTTLATSAVIVENSTGAVLADFKNDGTTYISIAGKATHIFGDVSINSSNWTHLLTGSSSDVNQTTSLLYSTYTLGTTNVGGIANSKIVAETSMYRVSAFASAALGANPLDFANTVLVESTVPVNIDVVGNYSWYQASSTLMMQLDTNGNIGLGDVSNSAYKFYLKSLGTTSTTSAVYITDSAGTLIYTQRDDGTVGIRGRTAIGNLPTAFSNTAKLGVTGETADSTANALFIQNAAFNLLFAVRNDGRFNVSGADVIMNNLPVGRGTASSGGLYLDIAANASANQALGDYIVFRKA